MFCANVILFCGGKKMKKLSYAKIMLPILIGVIVLACALIRLGVNNQHIHQLDGKQKNTIRYVLVNEDLGAKFNGKSIQLGRNFVNLINQDTAHSWQVAPLNVAEAGFNNGSYDVEIILPQNFSQKLLNLQSMNPQKAQITYKVRKGSNERTNKIVQEKVGAILNSFNQKVIKMYFSSVLANLSEAQRNVTGIVTGEQETQATLSTNVQTPFKSLPESFTEVISTADSLKGQNQSWQDQQNEFSKSTQAMLVDTGKDVNDNAQALTKYIALLKQISTLNVKNADAVMTKQSETDTKVYRDFYDTYEKTRQQNFGLLETKQDDEQPATGLIPDMEIIGTSFSEAQQKRITDLTTQIASLNQQKSDLQGQLNQTQEQYFNGKTPEEAQPDDIKISIKKMLRHTVTPSILPAEYLENIEDDKDQITTATPELVTTLMNKNLIDASQAQELMAQYRIVNQYVNNDLKKALPNGQFTLINAKDDSEPGSYQAHLKNTMVIPTNNEGRLSLIANRPNNPNQKLKIINIENVVQRINQQIKKYRGMATAQPDNSISIAFKTPRKDDNETVMIPEQLKISFDVALQWQFNEKDKQNAYRTLDYKWQYQEKNQSAEVQSTGELSCFVNTYQTGTALKNDITQIIGTFDTLGKLSQQLVAVFGSPSIDAPNNATLTTSKFAAWLAGQSSSNKLADIAADDSVYNQYGYISQDTIAGYMVDAYREQGTQVWQATNDQINKLEATLNSDDGASLNATLNTLLGTPSILLDQKDKIMAWYQHASRTLDETYKKWQDNPKIAVNYKQYEGNESDEINNIYYDQTAGDDILKSFETLNTSSQEQAKKTAEGAAKVESLSDEFQTLTKTTKTTNETASKVLKETNSLVGTVTKKTSNNQSYANNFKNVLQNTHTGGADNQNVFNFLANPLTKKGEYKDVSQTTSSIPYLMTVLTALMASIIAFGYARKTTANNSSALFSYLLLTVLIGATTIAKLTFAHSGSRSAVSWSGYTIIISLIIAMNIYWVSRQFPKIAPYLFGFIVGIYLMLTPILGFSIQAGTPLAFIYRVSPLQNIENSFGALLTGNLSQVAMLVLSALVIGSLIINILIILGERKEVQHVSD
ncbi:type VII secretion protein EsaA [Lactobacillus curvatus]|nr:type VII secretion protein EsaA [Latilactobacillus curvatus]MSE23097.1 type VII secretion protein EsaA [Latilactobacillus curvatus]